MKEDIVAREKGQAGARMIWYVHSGRPWEAGVEKEG